MKGLNLERTDDVIAIQINNIPLAEGDQYIALAEAFVCDDKPTVCRVHIKGDIASGDTPFLYVCNNANDAAPTWENATEDIGREYLFTNSNKTAANWGIGILVGIKKNSSEPTYVKEISGDFR